MNAALTPTSPHATDSFNALRAFCDFTVWLTFAGLVSLRGPASPGTMAALLALTGFALLVYRRDADRKDLGMAALFLVLPAHDALNMALTGWDAGMLDKSGRLILGFFVYFAISRVGIHARALRWGVIAGCIAAAALAAYQAQVLGLERASGFMNAIPFGNDALLLGFLALAAWIVSPRAERTPLLHTCTLTALACAIYASYASGTRGGWVVAPALIWILSLGARDMRRSLRTGVTVGILSLLVIGLALLPVLNERTANELNNVTTVITTSNHDAASMTLSSIGTRLHLYRIGFDAFMSRPVLGIGVANLSEYLAAGAEAGTINPAAAQFTHLHSGIVDTLARGGLLGLAALAYFVLGLARHFHRALVTSDDDDVRYFALTGLLCIAAALLFSLSNVFFPAIVGTNILLMTLAVPAGALACRTRRTGCGKRPGAKGATA
ncbi:MAG: O-antigen ligase family protein [Azoarcus sp.]|jgi:O-antigen ligase|nr:O-antigen ligase family protein [Azoarcus sp.]